MSSLEIIIFSILCQYIFLILRFSNLSSDLRNVKYSKTRRLNGKPPSGNRIGTELELYFCKQKFLKKGKCLLPCLIRHLMNQAFVCAFSFFLSCEFSSLSICNVRVHTVTYLGRESCLTQAAVEQKQRAKQASCFKIQVRLKKKNKKKNRRLWETFF